MAGYPDFQRLAVTLPSKSQAFLSPTWGSVPAGWTVYKTVYAPAGTMAAIVTAYASVNQSGATSGDVSAYWSCNGSSGSLTECQLSYNGAWPLGYNNGSWVDGNGSATGSALLPLPVSPANQAYWLGGGTQIDDSGGFSFTVVNGLNVDLASGDVTNDIKVIVEDLP